MTDAGAFCTVSGPVFAVNVTAGALTGPVTVTVGAVMSAALPAVTLPTPSATLSSRPNVVAAEPVTLDTAFDALVRSTAPPSLVAVSAPPPVTCPLAPSMPAWPDRTAAMLAATVLLIPSVPVFAVSVSVGAVTGRSP